MIPASWLSIFDSVMLVAILSGLIHVFVRIGEVQLKVNTMWTWWLEWMQEWKKSNGKE